jgi:hypothetical protein
VKWYGEIHHPTENKVLWPTHFTHMLNDGRRPIQPTKVFVRMRMIIAVLARTIGASSNEATRRADYCAGVLSVHIENFKPRDVSYACAGNGPSKAIHHSKHVSPLAKFPCLAKCKGSLF